MQPTRAQIAQLYEAAARLKESTQRVLDAVSAGAPAAEVRLLTLQVVADRCGLVAALAHPDVRERFAAERGSPALEWAARAIDSGGAPHVH